MVATTPTGDENQPVDSDILELYDASTGRNWLREAIDRFVVGRIHGSYDWAQICLHLSLAYSNFTDITSDELQRFWNNILPRTTIITWWSYKNADDSEVRKVLDDITVLMEEAQETYDGDYDDYKILWWN